MLLQSTVGVDSSLRLYLSLAILMAVLSLIFSIRDCVSASAASVSSNFWLGHLPRDTTMNNLCQRHKNDWKPSAQRARHFFIAEIDATVLKSPDQLVSQRLQIGLIPLETKNADGDSFFLDGALP